MDEQRFTPSAPSPPPSYNSLFPESQGANHESNVSSGDCRRTVEDFIPTEVEQICWGQSYPQNHQQYIVIDDESLQSLRKNQQKIQKSPEPPKLTSINIPTRRALPRQYLHPAKNGGPHLLVKIL